MVFSVAASAQADGSPGAMDRRTLNNSNVPASDELHTITHLVQDWTCNLVTFAIAHLVRLLLPGWCYCSIQQNLMQLECWTSEAEYWWYAYIVMSGISPNTTVDKHGK